MSQILPTCPNCNAPISVNAKFCRECGKPIEIAKQEPTPSPSPTLASTQATCPHCDALISPTAKFCRECGEPITEPANSSAVQMLAAAQQTCQHCDALISPTDAFCNECGNRIEPSTAPARVVTASAIPRDNKRSSTRAAVRIPTRKNTRRVGYGSWILGGCLVVILLCAIAGVGGYLAYQNDLLTMDILLTLVGRGPIFIEAYDFRDDTVHLTITELSAPENSEPATLAMMLDHHAVQSINLPRPGRYDVQIGTSAGGNDLGRCSLSLRYGDQFQFIPFPDLILVNRLNEPSSISSDFVVPTSSLCR